MTVAFKAPLKSSVVNAAFMSRTSDTSTTGKVALSNSLSGTNIVNLQQYINEIIAAIGVIGEGDATANNYTEQNFIVNGDSYKEAIDKLDQSLNDLFVQVNNGNPWLLEYSSDGAFEIANGAPPYIGKTGIYFNTTDSKVRYYDSVGASWEEVGSGSGGGIGYQEFLGQGNGVITTYPLSFLPASEDSILVFFDSMSVNKSEWSFVGPNLVFGTAPDLSVNIYVFYLTAGVTATTPVGTGVEFTEYHTMTLGEIIAKQFTMSATPVSVTKVLCDIVGGTTQVYTVDFIITGNVFSFNGLGLDGILNTGDVVRLFYIQ